MPLFYKGIVLGFSIAAPVGPIGLLCIRRTLTEGKLSGFVSGLGAATADAFYGFVAAFGLTAISSLLLSYKMPIALIGGFFLLYLAIRIFFSGPSGEPTATQSTVSLSCSYLSTAFLTLTNPATILSFIAVFAGVGIVGSQRNYGAAIALVLGVFLGSALWWLFLSSGVGWFNSRLSDAALVWINRVSGLLMAGLGVTALLEALR